MYRKYDDKRKKLIELLNNVEKEMEDTAYPVFNICLNNPFLPDGISEDLRKIINNLHRAYLYFHRMIKENLEKSKIYKVEDFLKGAHLWMRKYNDKTSLRNNVLRYIGFLQDLMYYNFGFSYVHSSYELLEYIMEYKNKISSFIAPKIRNY